MRKFLLLIVMSSCGALYAAFVADAGHMGTDVVKFEFTSPLKETITVRQTGKQQHKISHSLYCTDAVIAQFNVVVSDNAAKRFERVTPLGCDKKSLDALVEQRKQFYTTIFPEKTPVIGVDFMNLVARMKNAQSSGAKNFEELQAFLVVSPPLDDSLTAFAQALRLLGTTLDDIDMGVNLFD